jgi:hypothetical protein
VLALGKGSHTTVYRYRDSQAVHSFSAITCRAVPHLRRRATAPAQAVTHATAADASAEPQLAALEALVLPPLCQPTVVHVQRCTRWAH